MRSKSLFLLSLILMAWPWALGQPARRFAILAANGPMAKANQQIALVENLLVDSLTAKLTGQPGLTVVDRADIQKVLAEVVVSNADISSPTTAARVGKLVGAGQIVLVDVYYFNWAASPETSGNTTRTNGTIVLRANARMVDVETGAILVAPSSEFEDTALISTASKPIWPQNAPVKTTGRSPLVVYNEEWAKASDAVTAGLAAKLTAAIADAPPPKMASPLVAGIANGSVYINQGSTAGIKVGDKFQVVREVSVGLNDPATGRPIVQKQSICVLTVANADETSASGTCPGGLPQSKDVAQPMHP
jgi:hypothetical protein